jgi:hypothetical protein
MRLAEKLDWKGLIKQRENLTFNYLQQNIALDRHDINPYPANVENTVSS